MTDKKHILVIGAQKAGTTSLYSIFQQHPQINSTTVKESKFFIEEQFATQPIEAYYQTFFPAANPQNVYVDVDPDLLLYSHSAEQILNKLGPNTQFIVCFRNPARRAHSAYLMEKFRGNESLPTFQEAIQAEAQRLNSPHGFLFQSYMHRGKYATLLKEYLNVFPKENFRFYLFEEDFIQQKEETLKDMFRFMGIPDSVEIAAEKHANKTRSKSNNTLSKLLNNSLVKSLRNSVKRFIPNKVKDAFNQAVFKHTTEDASKHKLSPEHYAAMNEKYFKTEIQELEKLIHRNLSSWF